MSRLPRIPGTSSDVWSVDVACGRDPVGSLVGALGELRTIRPGSMWRIGVAHDPGCPSLMDGGMPACTEIITVEARRAA